ncbi:Fanconi anemia group M protein isoform X4 [Pimephales promelas]|uniref:Fanconi anemia group M protein isoform X4 n=1 Tax=Pimephales promelas TaxID=90988 RepID=UPI001955EE9F|nr:Fanconi anemia group M protein isoform X4 [Pimephales promelas]
MSANQRTLFQTWGCNVSRTSERNNTTSERRKTTANRRKTTVTVTSDRIKTSEKTDSRSLWGETPTAAAEEDDDDDVMLVAVYEAERALEAGPEPGFDPSAGRIWIYPTNFPVREYQLRICEAALLRNTLVCLPTGLGKTFIAAVIMYNYYRWFPAGKIVFMAPTKPLVAQQIEACHGVMGIPQPHMAELTGSTAAQDRRELWRSRRVFFLTPQVMVNDLCRNTCPAAQVKCVVIDEAHKATGNHAYCQVVRELSNQSQRFRVLALSATPGGDVKAVQQVISNLLISQIELRSEDSPDVQAHVHQRSLEKIVVPLGELLTAHQTRYQQVLEKFTSRLTQMRLLSHRDLYSLSMYQIILAREQFRRNPPPYVQGPQQGPIEGDFAICITLYHGYDLLQQMGIRSLFLFFQNIFSGAKESSRARNELQRCPVFMDLYREMESMFATSSRGPQDPYVYSHPKLQKLDEVVLRHFQTRAESSDSEVSTRVMIFSSFRESVQEIAEILNRHQPLVKVMTFMGQASTGKGVRGFTQKEQLEVVRRFREGGFNTLVSTCVGEEGLDIGEVDLIVCFDAQKSPIRLVQRMGRTGRRRQGRIVVILAEGREERMYNQSQTNRHSINKSIMGNKHSFQMFPHSPRMLPAGVTPALHKMLISVGQFEQTAAAGRRSTKGRRSALGLQTAGAEQSCVKDKGFLTAAEEVVWRSTMRLGEDEAQPVFRPASLMTFSDLPPSIPAPEPSVAGPVRELSLWEWRHWQNRPLHTHTVGHSERCLHFTSIMELIDRLRQEEQGDCSFESELKLHLQKEDVDGTTNPNADRTRLKKRSRSHDAQRGENGRTSARPIPSAENRLDTHDGFDPESDPASQHECLDCLLGDPEDESSDLQHMFYQPEQNLGPKRCRHSLTTKAFRRILADVEDLLSRSPPQEPSLPDLGLLPTDTVSDAFQVTFSLVSANREREDPGALSPGWDELFDDEDEAFTRAEEEREEEWEEEQEELREKEREELREEEQEELREKKQEELREKEREELREKEREELLEKEREEVQEKEQEELRENEREELQEKEREGLWEKEREEEWEEEREELQEKEQEELREKERKELREKEREKEQEELQEEQDSLDLFGDDEAFLQLSIPDIRTPDKSTEPEGEQADEHDPGSGQAFHCSQDFFSVNFDLGLESEDEECVDSVSRPRPVAGTARSQQSQTRPSASTPSRVFPGQADRVFPGQADRVFPGQADRVFPGQADRVFPGQADRVFPGQADRVFPGQADRVFPGQADRVFPGQADRVFPGQADRVFPGQADRVFPGQARPSASTPSRVFLGQADRVFPGQARPSASTPSRVFPGQATPSLRTELFQRGLSSAGVLSSDSEGETPLRTPAQKANPVFSPESKMCSDVESPVQARRKPAAALITSEDSDDFQEDAPHRPSDAKPRHRREPRKVLRRTARQFLDEEAELSEEEEVSSDEDDGDEQNRSLQGFVVNTTQCSQGLNDSEMQAFYLKSVRSPALQNRVRMTYKPKHNVNVFSQVPEQDETYAEDSFVFDGSEDEDEEGGVCDEEPVELIAEDSYVDGRRLYATRRRVRIRAANATLQPERSKRSRILRVQDSSEEEEEREGRDSVFKVPQCVQKRQRLAEELHVHTEKPESVSDAPLRVLVDSRCISSGSEVVSRLRLRHGLQVQVCSLVSADFIVSSRMCVELQSESEVSSVQNRRRLTERIQRLQEQYERVCVILQSDRCKPGEVARVFQRSRSYDGTLAALVKAGVRLLVSNGPDQTASILSDLTHVESRKGQAIDVPLEVKGHRQQALQFCLTLPNVSYITALNMCHRYSSVGHMIRSSVQDLQACARVSRSRAEGIYRCLRYSYCC